MASRSVLYLAHQENDGDALANKTITVTKPDGSALGVSLYDQLSGGSPVIAPETNAVGLKLLYANYADLDAAAVGRVKVSYSDAPSTTFDDALWPDPLDLFVDGTTRARALGGGLTMSGTVGLTTSIAHATNYAGSFRNTVGGVGQVQVTAGGSGYSNSFAVTFTGGGGSGATATGIASGGVVLAVVVSSAGSGYTSAPTPVFTAGSGTGATGTVYLAAPAFEVKDVTGAQAFWTDGNAVRIGTGKRLGIGSTAAPVDNLLLVSETVAETPPLGQSATIEVNVTGTGGDYSGLRSVIRDYANNQIHAAEFHLISNTVVANSGASQTRSALTLTTQVETAGATGIENNALRIVSGVFPEITTPAPTDNGILLTGSGSDFTNFIKGVAANGEVRFMVELSGQVTCGTLIPRQDDTHEIGASTHRWYRMYSNAFVAENGGAAGPVYTFRNDFTTGAYLIGAGLYGIATGGTERLRLSNAGMTMTVPVLHPDGSISAPSIAGSGNSSNSGLYFPSDDAIGFANNGTLTLIVSAAGLIDWRNGQNVTPGGGSTLTMLTATGGSGPTTAQFAGFIKQLVQGATIWVPYWI